TQVDGVAAPLLVRSALLQLAPEAVVVQKLSAQLEGTNTLVEGSLSIPRLCASTGCSSTFDLKTAELNLDDLNRILNPKYRSSDWLALPLQIFGGKAVKQSRFMTLQSQGTIAIGKLIVKNLVATRVTAHLAFNNGRMGLTNLQADLLAGKHSGAWHTDLSAAEPVFTCKGVVESLPVAQLNSLLRSPLGTGTLHLGYDLSLQGADAASLRRSAAGNANFRWTNGSWRTSGGASSLQFSDWSGTLTVRDQLVDVTTSVMQARGGPYQVSGQATFDRGLSLRLTGQSEQLLVSGTLQEARVVIQPSEAVAARDSASKPANAPPQKVRN
ncbi:MAG TPA: AsmA family protein, partial [Terriglobales bacterium]|nr:AsmA family protein [Terriglobales bacterium]